MDWFAGREQRRRWWPEAARLGRESNLGEGGMGFGRGRWRGCGVRGYKRAQAVANLCDLRAARREEAKPNALEGGCGWRRPGRREGSLAVVLRVMPRESSAIILYGSSASGGAGSEAQVKKGRSSPRHIDFG